MRIDLISIALIVGIAIGAAWLWSVLLAKNRWLDDIERPDDFIDDVEEY